MKERILISGGGSGLGAEIAAYCAAQGADIVICGRNESHLQTVCERIQMQSPKQSCDYMTCDLKDPEAIRKTVSDAFEKAPITGLVNNAAANFLCPAENLSPNGFQAIWSVVAQGSLFLTQAVGQYWIKEKIAGSVCSISTTYASGAGTFMVPSAMAKAAVEAMTRTLSVEWAQHGIRLNAVAPGFFPTQGAWSRLAPNMSDEDIQKRLNDYVPMNRYGEYKELAELVHFLLTSKARYMTGEVITIDGGLSQAGSAGPFYHEFKKFTADQWQMFRLIAQKRSKNS